MLIIRLVVEFQSPSSMSWSSVRMRMMFGRMLRLSLWRRGFRRCVEEKWAWQSATETNRKRRSRPAMAFDPRASPQPISCFPQVVSASGKHTKRPPRVQNRGSNKSAWDWATGLQRSPFPAPYFYSSTPLRESWHDPGLRIIHIYLGAPSVYAAELLSYQGHPACKTAFLWLTVHKQKIWTVDGGVPVLPV